MKFGYTILYVEDVGATVAFYEKAFGLKRKFISDTGTYAEMATEATTLSFAHRESNKPEMISLQKIGLEVPAPSMEIAFVTDEIEKDFLRAIEAGCIKVYEPTKKPWGQVVSYVRDLNGFLVEICTPVN